MTLINISGGAIKLIALISCLQELVRSGVKPKTVSGVSAGSIIAFCYVCGKLDEAMEIARKSHDIRVIFSKLNDPTRLFNQIRNLILGKNYLGVMDNLERNLRKIVTREDFEFYTENVPINCFILSVNERNQKQVVVNLKDLPYNAAIDHVIGSASIAPMIVARKTIMNHGLVELNDGGHRDHSAGAYLLKNRYIKKHKECITIWSRPEPDVYSSVSPKDVSNFFKRLSNFTISTFVRELSLNDEYQEKDECEEQGLIYSPIYTDYFTDSTYNITPEQVKQGEQIGRTAARKYLRDRKA
jgi:predicted patatin/cPLA2 family phospholipase